MYNDKQAKSISNTINETVTQTLARGIGKALDPVNRVAQAIGSRNTKYDSDKRRKIRNTALGGAIGNIVGYTAIGPIGGIIGSGIGGYIGNTYGSTKKKKYYT